MRSAICSLLLAATLALGGVAAFSQSFAQQRGQTPPAPQQQQPAPSPTPPEGPITVTIREVRVPVSVVDRRGQPVTGLTQSDFQILEDRQPQEIRGFTAFSEDETRLPLYIAVLMDTSASAAAKLRFEQEAALNFIHSVTRLRRDQVAFGTFDDEVRLLQDFTPRLDLLERAVNSVRRPGNQTSLYDAIWEICDEKMRSVPGRRVIVVISDGDDTYSRATLNEAIDIAQRTETIIFGISTKAGLSGTVPGVEAGQVSDRGDRNFERLCEETGGRAFFIGDMLALENSFRQVARELRSQYLITYRPTNESYDGRFRRIEVRLTGRRDNIRIRTRRGYTAVRDQIGQ